MRPVPIRLRVTAAFAVTMAAALAVAGSLIYVRVGSDLRSGLDRDLRLRAQALTSVVGEPGPAFARAAAGRFVAGDDSYAEVLDAHGRVLKASVGLRHRAVLAPAESRRSSRTAFFAERPPLGPLDRSRLLATPVSSHGRRLVLVVGAKNSAETLASLRNQLAIGGSLALLLAALAGYALAGMSLRPVEAMRRRAGAISAETSGERLPVTRTGDELEQLATTLNQMLNRLDQALERERSFVADAGHELRTPLALLRTELELALRHGETKDELREAIRSATEETDRLARLAEDLLLVAQTEQGTLPLQIETVLAAALLETVSSRYGWRADDAGLHLDIDAPAELALSGDRIRLEQALGNLVDNAIRHANHTVTLSADSGDGTIELHVRDDGAGFPSAFLERAFERFSRPDDARGRGGIGLGLSIVEAIARAHGGHAHARNLDGGGADVWITLDRDERVVPADAQPRCRSRPSAHEARRADGPGGARPAASASSRSAFRA
jgi:two-component system, OmpR family, sensor kinase